MAFEDHFFSCFIIVIPSPSLTLFPPESRVPDSRVSRVSLIHEKTKIMKRCTPRETSVCENTTLYDQR